MCSAQAPKVTLHVGDPAPPLDAVRWVKGTPVQSLGNGTVTVVEFWTTYDGWNPRVFPKLSELAKMYQGKATFVLMNSFQGSPTQADCDSRVDKFVKDSGDKMDFAIAVDGIDNKTGSAWLIASGHPAPSNAFIIDRDGKVAWIGHPLRGLDDVLGKVVAGTYDALGEAAKQAAAQRDYPQAAEQGKLIKPVLDALGAKDERRAVEEIDKLCAAHPEWKARVPFMRFTALGSYDEPGAQKYFAELAATTDKDDPTMLASMARYIVMEHSVVKHPDTKLAVRLAERAEKLSPKDPQVLDALAQSYFKADRRAEAIATERRAIAAASVDKAFPAKRMKELNDRLDAYIGAK